MNADRVKVLNFVSRDRSTALCIIMPCVCYTVLCR